jgi:hypothetical protein
MPAAQRMLRRAHQLMEQGNHKDAAEIFERLARGAEDRGMMKHAPHLYMQAGRANLLCGNEKKGQDLLNHGMQILAKAQRWPALARSGKRIVDELKQLGHPEMADEISVWLTATLPEPLESYQQVVQPNKQLPLKCPNCGGALRPDEVEYLDASTGECPYCGSAVRGE